MPRNRTLYGLHMYEAGTPIVLVEGTMDAINLFELGVRSPMACLGAHPSPAQLNLASSLSQEIYVMGDGDKAGLEMNVEVQRYFENTAVKVTVVTLKDKMDPGVLSRDEILLFGLPLTKTVHHGNG
jgi:DNA primase